MEHLADSTHSTNAGAVLLLLVPHTSNCAHAHTHTQGDVMLEEAVVKNLAFQFSWLFAPLF